jgi:hypothetical protein
VQTSSIHPAGKATQIAPERFCLRPGKCASVEESVLSSLIAI